MYRGQSALELAICLWKANSNYTLKKLENYKVKDDLLTAVAEADAMIIRSDIVDEAVYHD